MWLLDSFASKNFLLLLVFTFVVLWDVECTLGKHQQGPAVELMTWGKSLQKKPDIYLKAFPPQYSLVVLIVNETPWTQPGLEKLSGKFSVIAPEGQGIMAVIQVLNLRADRGTSGCRDYIKFHEINSTMSSPAICGQLKKDSKIFMPEKILGPRVFHSPQGKISVQYVSEGGDEPEEWEESSQMFYHIVEIVFTSYKACDTSGEKETADINNSVTRCGDKCISSTVLCDEAINCGFEEDFANDEMNCVQNLLGEQENHEEEEEEGQKVPFLLQLYLGAGLFILLLIAVAWYHHKKTMRRLKNIPHY